MRKNKQTQQQRDGAKAKTAGTTERKTFQSSLAGEVDRKFRAWLIRRKIPAYDYNSYHHKGDY
jgi:hypothetical protein